MIDTPFEWTLKKSEKERFIEYFNKNYFTFNKVWRFLYHNNKLALKTTKLIIGAINIYSGNLIWMKVDTNQLFHHKLLDGLVGLVTIVVMLYTIRLLFFINPVVDERIVDGNPYFRVRKLLYYWSSLLFCLGMAVFLSGHEGTGLFVFFMSSPCSTIYCRNELKKFYKSKLFREYGKTRVVTCKYLDFVDRKLPNENDPKLELNQILSTKISSFPRNKAEKELIQFINPANGGLVWTLTNNEIADRLIKQPGNTLTAKVLDIQEFGKLELKLTRNFLLQDE